MPLVTTRGFQLAPDIGGGLTRGFQAGSQLQQAGLQRQLLEEQLRQQQAQTQAQQQTQGLLGQVFGQQGATPGFVPQQQTPSGPLTGEGGVIQPTAPTQTRDQALAQIFARDPALGDRVLKSIGVLDQRKATEAANFAFDLENTPIDQRTDKINARAQQLKAQGRDPRDTLELLDMPLESQNEALKTVQMAALPNAKRLDLASGRTASIKAGVDAEGAGFFAITPEGARRIPGARPTPKAEDGVSEVQSSKILPGGAVQIVRKDGTVEVKPPEDVAKDIVQRAEERGVDLQQRRAQGRELGKEAAKVSAKAFEQTGKLRSNNRSLRQVVDTVRAGAETGPLVSKLPSFRAESVRLDQLRNQLGLDVIGSVTFGALSEGELNLALDTALPTGLDRDELVQWAEDKIEVQEKLATYLEDQAMFLSEKGNTPAMWLQRQRELAPEATPQAAPQAAPVQQVGRFQVEVVE